MAEGLVGISERQCIFSAYKEEQTERTLHCHLYNRYTSDRTSTYERYYTPTSEKTVLASRELIYNERTSLTSSFDIHISEVSSTYGQGYTIESDERNSTYNRWYTAHSNRYIHFAITEISERTIYQFCIWNDYRFGYTKSWHVSERYGATLGKLYDSYADQRNIWYQLYPSPVSVRNVCFESCNFKYSFTIKPQLINILSDKNVGDNYKPLFEDEPVTSYKVGFNFIKVKDNIRNADLEFVFWNPLLNKYVNIPISVNGILRLPLFRYGETQTLFIEGFFIPINNLFYFGFYPFCNEYSLGYDNSECMDKVEDAIRHGYIKLEIFGRQYRWNTKDVIGNVKYQPVMFKFYIAEDFIKEFYGIFNMRMLYGYPEQNITHNIIIQFTAP